MPSKTPEQRRTDAVWARVTPTEKQRISEYAQRRGCDVSALTRELWLRELTGFERHACTRLFELFRRTIRDQLRLGGGFTVEHFERICHELDNCN